MTKRILLIIPYFGKLPNYFNLWLKTAQTNKSFNWLLLTDDKTNYEYPENVKCVYCDFDSIVDLIQSRLDFPVSLKNPYKLCDFRPTYGFIFQDYIKGYDFWGYTDLDLLYGNLSNFFNDQILNEYDRFSPNGHLSIFRNCDYMNQAYTLKVEGFPYYKDVFNSPKSFAFDEWPGITSMLKVKGYKQYLSNTMADIKWTSFKLKHTKAEHKKYSDNFVWEDGHIFQICTSNDGSIVKKEFSYLHLQKRAMINRLDDKKSYNTIYITPYSFEATDKKSNLEFMYRSLIFYVSVFKRKGIHFKNKILTK